MPSRALFSTHLLPPSRVLLLCALLSCFALGMAGQLFVFKYAGAIKDIRASRIALIAGELRRNIERGAAIGLTPTDAPALREAIRARLAAEPLIRRIAVADPDGHVILTEGRADVVEREERVVAEAKNSFDLTVGRIAVVYEGEPLQRQVATFRSNMLFAASTLALVCTVLSAAGIIILRRRGHSEKFALAGILPWLVAGVLALGGMTYRQLQADMTPEFVAKAEVVGRSAASLFERAVDLGVPLDGIPGVESYFDGLRKTTPAFAEISVSTSNAVLYRSGEARGGLRVALPIPARDGEAGRLNVVIDPAAVQRVLRDMVLDLATIIVVSGFLAVELFRFLLAAKSGAAANDRDRNAIMGDGIARLRAPVFLLFLAEDLTRPFLPVFAGQLPAGPMFSAWSLNLSAKAMAGLPVIVFMLLVALAQPFVGGVVRRFGGRRVIVAAALGGALSHLLAAWAGSGEALLGTRVLAALCWAMAFATAQVVVLDGVGRQFRAAGMGYFVGIIMAASICGPSIGGILADSLGYRGTFLTAMTVSLLAAILMRKVHLNNPATVATSAASGAAGTASAAVAPVSAFGLLANRRFAQLMLLAAIPAKVILIAYCYYLVPVYIGEWGGSAADAGRIQMIYALAMVLAVPYFARGAVPGRQAGRVAAGLLVSGMSGLALLWPNLGMAMAMALILGIGQSIGIAAQAALVGELCAEQIAARGEAEVYGIYRLLERLGNALGPAVAALLAGVLGASGAFAALGGVVALGGLVFGRVFAERRSGRTHAAA